MNYFAHGMRFIDRPWFLAGTALPDWLSVADRGVRMRSRNVEPLADGSGSIEAELAAGILQHFHDDQWFHRSLGFFETTGELTRLFRERLGSDEGFHTGFLGHIVTELILDGVLIDENPGLLDSYYAAFATVDSGRLQDVVNRMAPSPTTRLAGLVPLFRQEQFLRDYQDPRRLLYRLNQVLRRIKLKQLPEEIAYLLGQARPIVEDRVDDLLPESHFSREALRP